MRRKDRDAGEAFARDLLATCEYATLSMSDGEGNPYGVPISPVLEGDTVYIHCATEGKKLDLIRKCPRVCISCVGRTEVLSAQYTTAFESAIAFGIAQIVEDEAEKMRALRLICEKYAPHHLDIFEDYVAKSIARTGVVRINLTAITGKRNDKYSG